MGTIPYTAEECMKNKTLPGNPRICLVDPHKESKWLKIMITEPFINIIK
jgi:hypothetical protein